MPVLDACLVLANDLAGGEMTLAHDAVMATSAACAVLAAMALIATIAASQLQLAMTRGGWNAGTGADGGQGYGGIKGGGA